jgi:exo-1,4-beta-D-glucosaminidase
LSTKPDVLQFDKSEWYFTPISSYADLSGLQRLPKTAVNASFKAREIADETSGTVTLENPGKDLAFLVRLRLLKGAGGPEILPVFWEDNYICLLPGEKREVAVHVRRKDAGSAKPVLAVDGFNVTPANTK